MDTFSHFSLLLPHWNTSIHPLDLPFSALDARQTDRLGAIRRVSSSHADHRNHRESQDVFFPRKNATFSQLHCSYSPFLCSLGFRSVQASCSNDSGWILASIVHTMLSLVLTIQTQTMCWSKKWERTTNQISTQHLYGSVCVHVWMHVCMILHDMHDMDDMDVCVSVCLYVCVCVSHMFRIQRGFTYVFTCVAYTLHMHFTHALHTFHKVIMYVSYWFGTQITYVSHAFYIHMFCMRKRLRICIRTPLSGSYRRKPWSLLGFS